MSQTSPDNVNTRNCSLKRKISPVRETEKGETTPVVHNENNSKRCMLDENSRPGFALHALELNSDQQNNEGKVMRSLIEKKSFQISQFIVTVKSPNLTKVNQSC